MVAALVAYCLKSLTSQRFLDMAIAQVAYFTKSLTARGYSQRHFDKEQFARDLGGGS